MKPGVKGLVNNPLSVLPLGTRMIQKGCDGYAAKIPVNGVFLNVVMSFGEGWDHVSVSLPNRTPTWDEMCAVKDAFFDEEECVVQYHPPKSQYRNFMPFCLHLWKCQDKEFPSPHAILVAPTSRETMAEEIREYNRERGAV